MLGRSALGDANWFKFFSDCFTFLSQMEVHQFTVKMC